MSTLTTALVALTIASFMSALQLVCATVCWTCLALVVYAYMVYPCLIWILSRLFGRSESPSELPDADLPQVSLVVAAYNEEDVIAQRLQNALELDYPQDRIEILIGSDGSHDQTAAIVQKFTDQRVRLLDFAQNRGKASVLNELVAEASGAILLMSDANTMTDRLAVRRLVRWFVNPAIGVVVGRLVLTDPTTGRNVDSLYWKYETFLKRCEGRLGALLGANGAIYAIRREQYVPIDPQTIVDDFVIPLLARLHTGCAVVYDCEATASEETPSDVRAEFHRRARIGAGGFQSIGFLRGLLSPRNGWVAFTFFSHKVLRWLCPFFLLGALASTLPLVNHPLYLSLLLAQLGFYAISLGVAPMSSELRAIRPLRLTTMFTSMNIALLVGFWRWLRGGQRANWRRTPREPQNSAGAEATGSAKSESEFEEIVVP